MLLEWFSVLFFLLLLTKWQELGRLLRHALALIILDRGFVILAQISVPVLMFVAYNFAHNNTNHLIIFGLILYQMLNYSAILYRLYSLKINNFPDIVSCYFFGAKRLWHLFLLLVPIVILVAILIGALKNTEYLMFRWLGVNFFSNSIGTFITCLFFGVFSFFTYFLFVLVIIEKLSVYKAVVINFKIMKKLSITLLIQLTILMMLPGPWINIRNLPLAIGVYLWLLIGTSLSVVIYHEQKILHNINPNSLATTR